MITVEHQRRICAAFFQSCMDVFTTKEKEYAPEDIPLLDVLDTAVSENITILAVLRILHRKHVTATRHFDLHGHVTSDQILDRFRDIANYQALQVFYITTQRHLHKAWAAYWENQECQSCDARFAKFNPQCQRCLTLTWLATHPPSFEVSHASLESLD